MEIQAVYTEDERYFAGSRLIEIKISQQLVPSATARVIQIYFIGALASTGSFGNAKILI